MAACAAYDKRQNGCGGMIVIRLFRALICMTLIWSAGAQAQIRAQDGLALLDAGDVAGAVALWLPLAARGDALAQVNLGVLALLGQGGLAPDQAEGFFEKAAAQGDFRAKRALAELAIDRQDWPAARAWAEAAAGLGDAQAQFMAGWLADQGLGGVADPVQALAHFEQAAAQNHAPAQLALGRLLLEKGQDGQAAFWLERAAQANVLDAMFDLGGILSRPDSALHDPVAARAWYARAARGGHGAAMRNLALMQARGQGGDQSFRAALAWALRAAEAGQGEELAQALGGVMSDDQQNEARALAKLCQAPDAESHPACN